MNAKTTLVRLRNKITGKVVLHEKGHAERLLKRAPKSWEHAGNDEWECRNGLFFRVAKVENKTAETASND